MLNAYILTLSYQWESQHRYATWALFLLTFVFKSDLLLVWREWQIEMSYIHVVSVLFFALIYGDITLNMQIWETWE